MPRQLNTLTLTDARQIVAMSNRRAQELGMTYNIAGFSSVTHVPMDGAVIAGFSQRKA